MFKLGKVVFILIICIGGNVFLFFKNFERDGWCYYYDYGLNVWNMMGGEKDEC